MKQENQGLMASKLTPALDRALKINLAISQEPSAPPSKSNEFNLNFPVYSDDLCCFVTARCKVQTV
jgi:hypothetical protein